MRGTVLVVSILVLVPVTGAWQLPEHPPVDSEWIVADEDGWSHAEWVQLRNGGLEPLRQISQTEVLVWGDHGDYQMEIEPVLRGPVGDAYLVVLEPRLPSSAQHEILSMFDFKKLNFAGDGSTLPTSFEVSGIEASVFDSIPGIWWVEPLLETKARNAVSSSIMEHNSMEAHPMWDLGLNGTGVIVGLADSGIELDHGCFRHNETSIGEIGMGHRKVVLVNTTIDDGDHPGHSDYRHGTHIAGSVGCDLWHGNLTMGTSPSHGARILFQDIVNESGWSEPSVDWLLAEALANGAVIHSDSWGDDTEAYTLRSAEFDLWHREVPWSLAFIAPGNNPSKFYEPANARNIVSVGGSWTENNSNLYSASSHGPTEEGLRGNFIVAPAMGISSAAADGNLSSYNDDMRSSTGTSMSTPLGASITAVIQQMVQDGWFTDDGGFVPSGAMLRALLAMSAESMEGGQQGSETVGPAPDPLQGWGRPNLSNLLGDNLWVHDAYRMEESNRTTLIQQWLDSNGSRPLEQVIGAVWDGTGAQGPFLKQGDVAIWNLTLEEGSDVDVFLSFNQRPFGAVSDDLDVFVVLPDGTEFGANESLEGTERVSIPAQNLSAHEYVTVEVRATTVGIGNLTGVLGSDGDQLGFALTVRGVEGLVVEAVPEVEVGPSLSELCLDSHSGLAMHIHPVLDIVIRGEQVLIPANMGIDTSACPGKMHLLHTHDASGRLHIETYEPMVVNLTLFFGVWNISEVGGEQLLPLFLDPNNTSVSVNGVMQNVAWQDIELNDRDQILVQFDDSQTNDGGGEGETTTPCDDIDGDGVCDDIDNCLTESNPNQDDMDEDGFGDDCDSDIDGDGVDNLYDGSPFDPEKSGWGVDVPLEEEEGGNIFSVFLALAVIGIFCTWAVRSRGMRRQ